MLNSLTKEMAQSTSSFFPLTVTLGEPCVWDEGVVVPIQENAALQELRSSLYSISQDIIGSDYLLAGPSFYPHLTLSYANQSGSKKPIKNALEDYKDESIGTMTITGVELVSLWRGHQRYDYSAVSCFSSLQKQQVVNSK